MSIIQQTQVSEEEKSRIRTKHEIDTKDEREISRERFDNFRKMQALPYGEKYNIAVSRVIEFYTRIVIEEGANVHVSIGGLDSITLFMFIQKTINQLTGFDFKSIPGVSVSSLEDKSIQAVHE